MFYLLEESIHNSYPVSGRSTYSQTNPTPFLVLSWLRVLLSTYHTAVDMRNVPK